MLDQNQQLCRDLQNFKSVESRDVHQNFCLQRLGHLVFRIFKSLDAGDVHQNFCLQNLQHLIRNTIFRGWDCSSELPVSESSAWLLGKSSELSDDDYLYDQKHVVRSALECYCLRAQLLMECLLPHGQNLFYDLCSKR